MPTIQQILDDAKANPNTPQATQLREVIESGALDERAAVEGVQLPGRPKPAVQRKQIESGAEKNIFQKAAAGISESFKSGQERLVKGAELISDDSGKPFVPGKEEINTDVLGPRTLEGLRKQPDYADNYYETGADALPEFEAFAAEKALPAGTQPGRAKDEGALNRKFVGATEAALGAAEVIFSPLIGAFGAAVQDISGEVMKNVKNDQFEWYLKKGATEEEAGEAVESDLKNLETKFEPIKDFIEKHPGLVNTAEIGLWLWTGGKSKAVASSAEKKLLKLGDDLLPPPGGPSGSGAVADFKQFVKEFRPITKAEAVVKETGFIQIGKQKIPTSKPTVSGGILQSMHKPIPTKAQAFAESSGKPMGEWLVERGIIDTPENTVKKLFDRFTKSKSQADIGFEAIPGRFQDPILSKVANELLILEREIAKKGAASADKKFIEHLANSLQEGGLTMPEINSLKRLYGRKVKTEFVKDSTKTSTEIQAKTNVDNSLRKWQSGKAEELGFDDLAAINIETMQSRAVMDAIGERFLRKQSNNAVSLTDWIVASGGAANPAFFGALFGKKLVSADAFQALFAKALAKKATVGEPAITSLGVIERKAKIQEGAAAIRETKSATQPVLPREGKILEKPSDVSVTKPKSFSKAGAAEVPTSSQVKKAAQTKLDANFDEMVEESIKKNGKISSADSDKNLFKDVGYDGTNAESVHQVSKEIANETFKRNLNRNPGKYGVLYAGGSGSGKTSSITAVLPDNLKNAAAVYDGNLSKLSSFSQKAFATKKAGKDLQIVYVYRDPLDAWENGVIARMLGTRETGRVVPGNIFVGNTHGAFDVVKQIPESQMVVIDNSLGKGKAARMAAGKFDKIKMQSPEQMKKEIDAITNKYYDQGKITIEQRDALLE